jgi:hypothetical protein
VWCSDCGVGQPSDLPVFGDAPEPLPYAPSAAYGPPPVYLPTRPRPEVSALTGTGSSGCLILLLLGLAFTLAAAAGIVAWWMSYYHRGAP